MSKKVIIISSIVIAGLGVGAYFLFRKRKPKNDKQEPFVQSSSTQISSGSRQTSGGGGSTLMKNPFSTKEELLSFQRWVINVEGDKKILGKGGSTGFGDDGSWGKNSQNAYTKYSAKYFKDEAKEPYVFRDLKKSLSFASPYSTTENYEDKVPTLDFGGFGESISFFTNNRFFSFPYGMKGNWSLKPVPTLNITEPSDIKGTKFTGTDMAEASEKLFTYAKAQSGVDGTKSMDLDFSNFNDFDIQL